MVTQNGKYHGSHFPRHMTDDRHVFEPFCGFLLVICAEHGIALYSDLRRHPDASAQIRRAPFGHMRVRSLELAGLVDRRIDANIGCELVRRRKTGDISDFAENDGSNDRSNAGNRRDRRIKALKQSEIFLFPERLPFRRATGSGRASGESAWNTRRHSLQRRSCFVQAP